MSESLSQQERELLSTPIRPNSDTSPLNVFPTVGSRDEPHSDITDEQLAAIDAFHQSVAKRFSIVLSDLLQQIVDVQLQPLAIDTYSKFIFSRTSPTCLVTLNARPLRDQLGIDFAPNVLYPLIDCMLGGGRQPVEPPNRPLTQIERRLTIRITNVLLNELHDAWEHVLAVDLSIDQIETNAQRVRIVAPAEETITMTFRTRVSDQTGDITLCLPLRAVHKMIARLCGPADSATSMPSPQSGMCQLRATLGPIHIHASDLPRLRPGELLITDLPSDAKATICIDGEPRFLARPASLQGRKAVVIESSNSDVA